MATTGLPIGLPFLLCLRENRFMCSPTIVGGGGVGGVGVRGLVAPALKPPAAAWIGWPLAAVSSCSPPRLATPFWACTVMGKPGSLAREIVTGPLKVGSTLP